MGLELKIEGNPILEPLVKRYESEDRAKGLAEGEALGEARGEARGILIGKAQAFGAPDSVIESIREWSADDLDVLGEVVDRAIQNDDWNDFGVKTEFKPGS